MKTLHILFIVILAIFLVYLTQYVYHRDESYTARKFFDVPKYTPAQVPDSTPSKIPRNVIRCSVSNQLDEVFRDSIESCIKLNPEYEHVFFTNDDCDMFMANNFPGRVNEAYNKLVPGAYKADLFRLCYLYKKGGVYLDANKTLMVPLRDIISPECSFFSVIDLKSCNIFQAFIASEPGLPYLDRCIEAIVDNVSKKFYGTSDLSITGPGLLGVVFNDHYGFCISKAGEYQTRGETIKFAILKRHVISRDEYVYDDSTRIVDLNRKIRSQMNRFWQYQSSIPHYSVMWKEGKVYTD
jgi:hypothetical protein